MVSLSIFAVFAVILVVLCPRQTRDERRAVRGRRTDGAGRRDRRRGTRSGAEESRGPEPLAGSPDTTPHGDGDRPNSAQ